MITFTIQKPKEVVFEIKNVDLGADAFNRGYEEGEKAGYNTGYEIGAKEGAEVGYNRGKQEEYDRFWDAHQNFGNKKNYSYAFSGSGWTDETFKPKYNIVPTTMGYMFTQCGIVDLVDCLERCGVILDTSQCASFGWMMSDECKIKHFPTIDLSASAGFVDGFRYAGNLESGSLVNVKPTHTWSNAFANCSSLVDITFSGTIGKTISFAQSGKLSDASIQSIIEALADLTGETAQTLTFHKDVGGRLTQAQKDTISAKNWTLVY